MESGPLVVKVTLRYCGANPIDTRGWEPLSNPVQLFPPREWVLRKRRRIITLGGGIRSKNGLTPDRWQPGEVRSRVYYLHQGYKRIAAGPVRLRIEWPIYAPSKRVFKGEHEEEVKGSLLAKPSKTITVNVPRATRQSIRALDNRSSRNWLRGPAFPWDTRILSPSGVNRPSTSSKRFVTVRTRPFSPWFSS